jgi:hypothetical protein
MRTTLDIDDDVLAVAKEIARAESKTAGFRPGPQGVDSTVSVP